MKYCTQCGKELNDNDLFCSNCGAKVGDTSSQSNNQSSNAKRDDTLRQVAFVFMIVITVCTGFAIIPLFWMLPMTICLYDKVKKKQEISLAFKICILIFCGIIPGILLLIEDIDK